MEHLREDINGLNENMVIAALAYRRLGYRPLQIIGGTKGAAIKWKRLQTETPTEDEIRDWFGSGTPNIALVTGNGLVVVDCDSPEVVDLVVEHCGETPMRCKTPKPGHVHLYYRMRAGVHYGNSVKIHGRPIDLRCEGAYVLCPWSRTEAGKYEWLGDVLPVNELPLLKVSWLRERKPKMQTVEPSADPTFMEKRALAWLSRVEGAVSGCGGHNRTMRVAGKLIQFFRLDFETALRCIRVWNSTCEPEWSEVELLHKLQSAVDNMHKYVRGNP